MWYETIPSLAAVYLFLVIPGISIVTIQKYANGGKEQRIVRSSWQWLLWDRDRRLSDTGNYFDAKGLESIK